MAVPLTRNAFAEKHPDLFAVFSKRSENVLFSFFLHKTTKRYSFRKIFAVLSIILRLQKKRTEFLGNDHYHYHHHYHYHYYYYYYYYYYCWCHYHHHHYLNYLYLFMQVNECAKYLISLLLLSLVLLFQ